MRKLALTALALSLAAATTLAEDWPQWRGPRGDNISQEKGMPDAWPAEGLKQAWSAKVGIGYSSPVAVKGKVYAFGFDQKKEVLWAFDAAKGTVLWSQATEGGWTGQYPGTRATPTIEGDRIYTFGGAGDLVCRELADGKLVWHINVLKETGGKNLTWGTASNVLLMGQGLVVQAGDAAAAVAVDKATGKILWRSEAKVASYAQPVLIEMGGSKQLVVFGGEALIGMSPEDGKTLWKQAWPTNYRINASNPIYHDGQIFASSAYKQGSMMVKVGSTGAEKVWESKEIESRFQNMILDDGYVYVNSEGTLKCLKWPDAQVLWSSNKKDLPLGMGGSIVRHGERLLALSDGGKLYWLKATGKGFEKLSEMTVFAKAKDIWASPLMYEGRIYVKGTDELVCLEVPAK